VTSHRKGVSDVDIGMLWYDDSRKPLHRKVSEAVQYYKTKYGLQPTECHVRPVTAGQNPPLTVGSVAVIPNQRVLRDHFWIGVPERQLADG